MKWRNLRRRAEPTEKAATGRTKPSPPNRMRRREGDGGTHGTGRARRVCAALRAGRRLESPWRGRLRLHPRWPSRQVMGEPLRRGRRCADAICHHRYWGTASCRGGRSLRRLTGCGAGKEMGERTARDGRDAFVRPFGPGADWNRPGAGGCGFTRVGLPVRSWANRSGAGGGVQMPSAITGTGEPPRAGADEAFAA